MKTIFFVSLGLPALMAHSAQSQEADVLISVRGDRLHFHIWKGSGIPILFEAGGGDDSKVWADIAKPIREVTHATLITYDRAGFGQSELSANNSAIDKHGIENGIEELEAALQQLGYDSKIMLVAHSYGALYADLYASRHPRLVEAAVLIDGSSACWFTDEWLKSFIRERPTVGKPADESLGAFYQSANLPQTVEIMRSADFPPSIPVFDLVSENPPFSNSADILRWRDCHRQFVGAQSSRQGITAYGSGHYIYKDNPPLVIDVVIKAYSNVVDRQEASEIMKRYVDYAIEAANEDGRQHATSRH